MKMPLQLSFVLAILLLHSVFANDFFCSQDNTNVKIKGEISGRIITLIDGEATYRNDMECSWTLETEPANRIQIRVESSHLQWAPSESICDSHDHVDVVEGDTLLTSWCGEHYPKVINTKRNVIKIIFKTDESNPPGYSFRGVKLFFEVFSKLSCPPDWHVLGDFCYSKGHRKGPWVPSQIWCNQKQANLLSIKSQEEFVFINRELLNNSQEEYVWTGLNDIASPGTLKWLDLTTPQNVFSLPLPQPNSFYHCGAFRTADQRLLMKDCERSNFVSVCKANRLNDTALNLLPESVTNKGGDGSTSGRILLLGILIPAAVLLVSGILCLIIYKKCCGGCRNSRNRYASDPAADLSLGSRVPVEFHPIDSGGRGGDPPSYEVSMASYPAVK